MLKRLPCQVARLGAYCTRSAQLTEVCFLDPKFVLFPNELVHAEQQSTPGGPLPFVTLSVPSNFIPELSTGVHILGEFDDPQNQWAFGRRGEFFQYKYIGGHMVKSGFTCVLLKDDLVRLRKAGDVSPVSWDKFQSEYENAADRHAPEMALRFTLPSLPVLFAGKLLDCESASVLTLEGNKDVVGVTVSSDV